MHTIYQARRDNQGKITGDYLILSAFYRGEYHMKNKKQPWLANCGGYILLPFGVWWYGGEACRM